MVTPEELAQLRVPLSELPGLDPTGLRVWTYIGSKVDLEGVCTRDGGSHVHVIENPHPETLAVLRRLIDFDLADAATADRVARWVAGRVGLPVGCTAAAWRGTHAFGLRTWELWCFEGTGMVWFSADWKTDNPAERKVKVPGLGGLGPDDRRLPDGSRWVDRAALAIVARHVGRTP